MRSRGLGDALVLGIALFLVGATLSIDPSLLRRGAPLSGETEAVAAMISLSRDRDTRFDRDDFAASTAVFGTVPERIELVRRASDGALVYPRVGADVVLAAGASHIVGSARAFPFVHALALALGLGLVWRRLGDGSLLGAGWLATLVFATALPVQIFRFTPEVTSAALALGGLALLARGPRWLQALGALLLGAAGLGILGPSPVGDLLVFQGGLPGPDGSGVEAGVPVTASLGSVHGPGASLRAVGELWFGRFGGVLWTFPVLLVAIPVVLASRSPTRIAGVVGFVVVLSASAGLSPHGYAGGGDAFGVLSAVPLMALVVVASVGLEKRWGILAAWLLASVFIVEPLVTPLATLRDPGRHVWDGVQRWLPPERGRAGELPVLTPFRVDRQDRVRIQYLDGNAYRPSGDCRNFVADPETGAVAPEALDAAPPICFWTSMDRESSILLWTRAPLDELEVWLRGGPRGGGVDVALEGDARELSALPARVTLRPTGRVPYVEDGVTWWIHRFRVQAEKGWQPRLEGVAGDVRWLGVEVGLDLHLPSSPPSSDEGPEEEAT